MWRHFTNDHVIEENRHQNNVKTYINNKMFQHSLNLSNRTFKIDVKILDLLRRFKAGLVKVSASIRGPIRGRAFQWAQQAVRIFDIRKHFKTKCSCFEPNQPILTYLPQIEPNFHHYFAKQSLNWQNFQDGCPIFHWQRLWTIFLQWAFKFKILSTTFYKCAVLLESWNYKEWNLIFWFLSMCKLRRITHKFNIKPSGLYSICEWFAGVYTSIKTKK